MSSQNFSLSSINRFNYTHTINKNTTNEAMESKKDQAPTEQPRLQRLRKIETEMLAKFQ